MAYRPAARAKRRALPDDARGRMDDRIEKCKATVRAKVEHPFHDVKNLFGHKKNPYWGKAKSLAKNTAQRFTLFALAKSNEGLKGRDSTRSARDCA